MVIPTHFDHRQSMCSATNESNIERYPEIWWFRNSVISTSKLPFWGVYPVYPIFRQTHIFVSSIYIVISFFDGLWVKNAEQYMTRAAAKMCHFSEAKLTLVTQVQETSRQQTCVKIWYICVGHCGSVYLFWLEGGLNAIQCDTSARCKTLDSGILANRANACKCVVHDWSSWLKNISMLTHFYDTTWLNDKKNIWSQWVVHAGSGSCPYPVQPFPACLGKDFIETIRWVLGTTSLPLLQREVLPTVCRARNRCLTWDGWNMAMKNNWSRYPLVMTNIAIENGHL